MYRCKHRKIISQELVLQFLIIEKIMEYQNKILSCYSYPHIHASLNWHDNLFQVHLYFKETLDIAYLKEIFMKMEMNLILF
jgi:hypothetical protein